MIDDQLAHTGAGLSKHKSKYQIIILVMHLVKLCIHSKLCKAFGSYAFGKV